MATDKIQDEIIEEFIAGIALTGTEMILNFKITSNKSGVDTILTQQKTTATRLWWVAVIAY